MTRSKSFDQPDRKEDGPNQPLPIPDPQQTANTIGGAALGADSGDDRPNKEGGPNQQNAIIDPNNFKGNLQAYLDAHYAIDGPLGQLTAFHERTIFEDVDSTEFLEGKKHRVALFGDALPIVESALNFVNADTALDGKDLVTAERVTREAAKALHTLELCIPPEILSILDGYLIFCGQASSAVNFLQAADHAGGMAPEKLVSPGARFTGMTSPSFDSKKWIVTIENNSTEAETRELSAYLESCGSQDTPEAIRERRTAAIAVHELFHAILTHPNDATRGEYSNLGFGVDPILSEMEKENKDRLLAYATTLYADTRELVENLITKGGLPETGYIQESLRGIEIAETEASKVKNPSVEDQNKTRQTKNNYFDEVVTEVLAVYALNVAAKQAGMDGTLGISQDVFEQMSSIMKRANETLKKPETEA